MEPVGMIQPSVLVLPDRYQTAMAEAWNRFSTDHQLDPVVSPLTAASWRRSRGHENPNNPVEFTRMSKEHLLASQTASFDLIAIARPVMEDVYQCVQRSGTVIILANNVGCI